MPWLTPNFEENAGIICRLVKVPAFFIGEVAGALLDLTYADNWEAFGDMSPADCAATMAEMLDSWYESEGCVNGDGVNFFEEPPETSGWFVPLAISRASYAANTWIEKNLTGLVPDGTKAVFASITLKSTGGPVEDLHFYTRPGSVENEDDPNGALTCTFISNNNTTNVVIGFSLIRLSADLKFDGKISPFNASSVGYNFGLNIFAYV